MFTLSSPQLKQFCKSPGRNKPEQRKTPQSHNYETHPCHVKCTLQLFSLKLRGFRHLPPPPHTQKKHNFHFCCLNFGASCTWVIRVRRVTSTRHLRFAVHHLQLHVVNEGCSCEKLILVSNSCRSLHKITQKSVGHLREQRC